MPLISVITPTYLRHELLLNRCLPSVQAQDRSGWEHIIVSDGPDPVLRAVPWPDQVQFRELPEHDPEPHWGHLARLTGIRHARGDLIAYLDDDDDAWEPQHLRLVAGALLADPEAGFAFSRARVHMTGGAVRVGDGRPAHGRLVSSMVVHRRELLNVATWEGPHPAEDWVLFEKWLNAGTRYVSVDAETVHYYRSQATGNLVSFPPP